MLELSPGQAAANVLGQLLKKGHLGVLSCLRDFCQQRVLPRGATEQLGAAGSIVLLLLQGPGQCHAAALQVGTGQPEELLDLRPFLSLTSIDLQWWNLSPASSWLQLVAPERPRATRSGQGCR